MADGFLSRWSQRKQDVREGRPLAEPVIVPPPNAPVQPTPHPVETAADVAQAAAPELPTLEDAQQLTPASDFKPFMVRGVSADVKNAAMKKLFTDPHYNVMDGLDTYIDDYSIADPIPEAMLRKMVSAKFLNLFDEEEKVEAKGDPSGDIPRDVPDTPAPESVAQSILALEAPKINDDTPVNDHFVNDDFNMRLQPDHAPEPQGTGRGTA